MSYARVIPRDLFNEASLLKCLGALWIALDNRNDPNATLEQETDGPFHIVQNDADGSISVVNVRLTVRGSEVPLFRPLNSRQPWPLWASTDADDLDVFTDDGALSPEFLAFLEATP